MIFIEKKDQLAVGLNYSNKQFVMNLKKLKVIMEKKLEKNLNTFKKRIGKNLKPKMMVEVRSQ